VRRKPTGSITAIGNWLKAATKTKDKLMYFEIISFRMRFLGSTESNRRDDVRIRIHGPQLANASMCCQEECDYILHQVNDALLRSYRSNTRRAPPQRLRPLSDTLAQLSESLQKRLCRSLIETLVPFEPLPTCEEDGTIVPSLLHSVRFY
jgi:hypothetical protein